MLLCAITMSKKCLRIELEFFPNGSYIFTYSIRFSAAYYWIIFVYLSRKSGLPNLRLSSNL